MKAAVVTHTRRLLLPALGAALLGGAGCGDMPEDDPGAMERVTLIALLEPGDSGLQEVKLTRPVDLGTAVNDTTSFLPGATLVVRRVSDGASVVLEEDAAGFRYVFDRAAFPLAPGDSVSLSLQGTWNGQAFFGEQGTRIVSPDGLEFTRKPQDRSHGYDADTLMVYDPAIEENFTNPTAFHVDFRQECSDGCAYQYQIEFLAVVKDSLADQWVRTPASRLHWLRDDEELSWQVGPFPDLRLPPGERVEAQPVAWGFFVFVDEEGVYTAPQTGERRLGYYQITLRRLNEAAARFYYTTHWWIREQPTDPIEFNLLGDHCQGVVGSCARTSFRVAIVDDTPR